MDSNSSPHHQEANSPNVTNTNKRKKGQGSLVWDHFNRVEDDKCVCMYCGKNFCCDSKKHGTKTLWNHLDRCSKCILSEKQAENDVRQSILSFGPKKSSSGTASSLIPIGFDKEAIKKALAEMIIIDELPFKFVEKVGFRRFIRVACPKFECPSRRTIAREILNLYLGEKDRLRRYFKEKKTRVSLTTDIWTSIQNMSYMVITAHFIDDKWCLQKRILSFSQIGNHRGDTIGKHIESCLLDWGLDSIFCITVDNASANEVAINYVKKKLKGWKSNALILDGEFLHMRCFAHIINLIVNEGLRELHESIAKVRNAVRYVRSSPSRFQKFKACVEHERIEYKGNLVLDVSTRWNATYMMLESALRFEKAFKRMEEEDGHYTSFFNEENRLGPPISNDWEKVTLFVQFLKEFYDITLKFSASTTVTSNIVFHEMWHLQNLLHDLKEQKTNLLCGMATNMIRKFDKYCGSLDGLNKILLIAVILDPRFKLRYFSFAWKSLWDLDKAESLLVDIKALLVKLYDSYSSAEGNLPTENVPEASNPNLVNLNSFVHSVLLKKHPVDAFMTDQDLLGSFDEVETYLSNVNVQRKKENFDVLDWWKNNSSNYPVLSRLARDVYAVPISTVASEFAFSIGERVLDQFRSSLIGKMVESLICSQNWLMYGLIDGICSGTEIDPNENEETTTGDAVAFCSSVISEVMGSNMTSIECLDLDA